MLLSEIPTEVTTTNQENVWCSGLDLAQVIQKVDNAIHQINHYPVYSMVCFVKTYPPIYPVDSVIQPSNNWGQMKSGTPKWEVINQ